MTVSFERTREEDVLIKQIVARARAMQQAQGIKPRGQLDLEMDIAACHANGCPLDLERLSAADDFNFSHDVFGIVRHLNRDTGELENHFRPRYARKGNDDAK